MDSYARKLIDSHREKNLEILANRTKLLLENPLPACGDWVIFNDCERRISHIWKHGENSEVLPVDQWEIQTSNPNGSYYIGNGYVSYSGGLFTSFSAKYIEATDETKDAYVWFFDMDYARAHGGVTFQTPFKVWRANINAPTY